MSTDEEIGYPHNLIIKALNQSMTAINGNCERRVSARENIEHLVESLFENNTVTQRVYYISSRTSRLVDIYLQDPTNYKSLNHLYLIISKKLGVSESLH